ncbi:MAG: hypothetical protein FWH41_05465, partial [Treponema sp.]|nr:hypothetical protein [Treponema sp.]
MKNNNLPKQQKLQRQKTARTLVIAACSLLICNCDLFNKPVDPDYIKKIDAEIAYANAPWVPIEIDNGGLGTSVPEQGSHAKTVKYRYSFVLRFQPARDYPFSGWQAWHADEEPFAVWRPGQPPSESGADKVRFMPINADGTEVEVFVYVKPSAGKLIIGPWGAHIPDLNVTLDDGLLGTMFPAAISGVKKGYPFNLSFRPDPQFPFRGWQLQFGDDEGTESFYSTADGKIIGEESDGNVRWIPLNMTGNEMSITIENLPSHNITIKPIDADSALTEVRTLSDSRWGTSFPVSGTVQTRRQGFSFSVEFTPLTGWVFRGWKAYAFSGQNAGSLNPNTLGEELPEEKVKIEQISGKASITVLNVDGPVLLVPLCVQQLRVTLTSPPLFSAISYPRSQQVRIEFSTALNPATAVFGKDSIQITDSNNDPCYSYFNDPSYNETDNSITLIPKAANLPPENRVITVIAGTAIESEFGETLSEPVTITYSTNNEKIEKAYQAGNIWAIHDPLSEDQFGSFDGTQFFNQRENFDRDRRLRKNTGGSYEITLYFGVTRSTEEIVSPSLITNYSQYIEIAEINYATLSGNEIDGLGKPAEFAPGSRTVEITEMENNANTAGLFYRNGNAPHPALGTSYYKAVYTWNEPPANGGIIRLAVLPRYDGTGPEDPDRVEAESWETLVAAGRGFVTAVFDNSPPGGDASIELGGAASLSGKVYNYNETSAFMSIAANFVNITDN